MTGETENLVLESLRGMRGGLDGLRRGIAAVKQDLRTVIAEKFEAVETQFEGLRYVVVASVGPLVTDMKDRDARIARLEGTRA